MNELNIKFWKKSKLPGQVIDHALYCSKVSTNDAHHLLNELIQFVFIILNIDPTYWHYLLNIDPTYPTWNQLGMVRIVAICGAIDIHSLVPVPP